MPVNVGCPTCQRKLRIEDELLGKKVRCPDCKTIFVSEAPPPTEPVATITTSRVGKPPKISDSRKKQADEEEEDEENVVRKPKRLNPAQARPGWRAIRLALSLLIWAVNTWLAVAAIAFVGFLLIALSIALAAKLQASFDVYAALSILMSVLYIQYGLGALASFILSCVGHGFLWQVPNQPGSGLRPLGIATMALFFGALVLSCGGSGSACFMSSINDHLGVPLYFCSGSLAVFSTLAWFFVFWIFMRFICVEARNRVTAQAPIFFMIVFPVYNILGPIFILLIGLVADASLASSASRDPTQVFNSPTAMPIILAMCWVIHCIILWCLLLWSSFILQEIRTVVEGLMWPQ